MSISGRIRPVPRLNSNKTRAVRCHLTGRTATKDCECCAGFYFNSIFLFFGRSLGSFQTLKSNTMCIFTAEKWFLFDTKELLLNNFFQNTVTMVVDDFHEHSAWPCFTFWTLYPYPHVLILGKVSNTCFISVGRRRVRSQKVQSQRTACFLMVIAAETLLWTSVLTSGCMWL